MDKKEIMEMLFNTNRPMDISNTFNFDLLTAPPLTSFLSEYDMVVLNDIIRDPVIAGNDEMKRKFIHDIVEYRGFVRLGGGTNRIVFRHKETQDIVIKVAIDEAGAEDSPKEMINQMFLKPYVTKVFDVSRFGNVGLFERVEQVTNIYQFMDIWEDVYKLITDVFISGGYALNDIGTDRFKNYGIRKGWGPVLVDFPYLYEIDPNKLYCDNIVNGKKCGAEVDFDDGCNSIVCTKCGKVFSAADIGNPPQIKIKTWLQRKETTNMKIVTMKGDKVINTSNTIKTANSVDEVVANAKATRLKVANQTKKVEEANAKVEEKKNPVSTKFPRTEESKPEIRDIGEAKEEATKSVTERSDKEWGKAKKKAPYASSETVAQQSVEEPEETPASDIRTTREESESVDIDKYIEEHKEDDAAEEPTVEAKEDIDERYAEPSSTYTKNKKGRRQPPQKYSDWGEY